MTFKKRKLFCILLCAVLLVLSASCSGGGGTNDGSTPSDTKKPAKTEKDIKITQTAAKSAETEKYETADFTVTIPKGWKVTSGGTNIYHSIRVYDPEEPINQMFILLKADILLHSEAGKAAWQQNYNMGNTQAAIFTKAPVLQNPSTEGFFQIFPQYVCGSNKRLY